ncbi:ADL352Cp [Eremothecium gossypii ATCC 10895]|uniref:ADL352Cp n=1 Tax=Eremothecium gossypii (strain ATCC 10895 / CBS 109.51 / FGSC 9923 / NRRL Y-1056) TaxID=284811 RepID=Q75BB9_EREGS|nr:ADL352Cp [Eremothecium gossypii ATCC 10895]AAS51567.2 ADL352Cp [Eremothecium gossypii ATCC 10895]AEY95864.1 FADL352Cp [Eremothecium gossypii FDAG1]
MASPQTIDLTTLTPAQLAQVKQQFDQELQHFTKSLQALSMARAKFNECIADVKVVSEKKNSEQRLLVPLAGSLYVPGKVVNNQKFMVDIGTGYYVEKDASQAIEFYQKKVNKLNKEAVQIQDIIKEKTQSSLAIEAQMRKAAIKQHEEIAKQKQQAAQ